MPDKPLTKTVARTPGGVVFKARSGEGKHSTPGFAIVSTRPAGSPNGAATVANGNGAPGKKKLLSSVRGWLLYKSALELMDDNQRIRDGETTKNYDK
ncbi:Protein of unknown function [Gryllus bimaculatus]|nr:Protein of unknown function [Gryllus bimaculatus]